MPTDENTKASTTGETKTAVKRPRKPRAQRVILPTIVVDEAFLLPHLTIPMPIMDEDVALAVDRSMHMDPRRIFILAERRVTTLADDAQRSPYLQGDLMGLVQDTPFNIENFLNEAGVTNELGELFDSRDDAEYELCDWGVVAEIAQYITRPGGAHIVLNGVARGRLRAIMQEEPYVLSQVEITPEPIHDSTETQVAMAALVSQVESYIQMLPHVPGEVLEMIRGVDEPGWLADLIAFSPEITSAQRQEMLEIIDPLERIHRLSIWLQRRLDVMQLRNEIQHEAQAGMDRQNREYFLREQMRAIQRELGESNSEEAVAQDLRERIEAAGMPEEVHAKAVQQLERLEQQHPYSPEIGVIRTYIEWLVDLPWSKATEDHLDLQAAADILNEDHYGLEKVKDRIVEFIAVRKLAGDKLRSPILCFVGPPGVGKTSLGKSIARAIGREYVRMSLGGVRDEAEIRGHRRTYVGAMPGRVIKALKDAGTRNPVIVLDEVDKLGADTFRGDPSSALLEVLDPEQNTTFSDHYLEVPFDLSQVIFITTANMLDPIPPALRDRMEIIEVSGYTEVEKLAIATEYLLPKTLESHGLTAKQMKVTTAALQTVIREYTEESGVRNLEREIGSLARKVARQFAGDNPPKSVKIDSKQVYELLGVPRYDFSLAEENDEVGVAMGAAVTSVGGDLLSIEVNIYEGKGELMLTGQLGDVMQESARAALSYARAHKDELGIPAEFFEKHTVHVHIPAGAIPKDGPSAGITMATAMVSAITGQRVRKDVAMTGEITLRGKVLPIGGLREKTLAAHRGGIKTFLLPKKNAKDLSELPDIVKNELELIEVAHINDVLEIAFVSDTPKRRRKSTGGTPKPAIESPGDEPRPAERTPRLDLPGEHLPAQV
ncbi:MAG: endopeptidase La [Thermomicrobiales bacterium]|nr:endopeptidase La [Thermomicrobiales bacterium]